MNTDRPCGCKSFRSCLICEAEYGLKKAEEDLESKLKEAKKEEAVRVFCPHCKEFLLSTSDCPPPSSSVPHFNIIDTKFSSYGIKIIEDFISEKEEEKLINDLDEIPWDLSQSGRRKQNFGPRANFNKRKTKLGNFSGFPLCTKFVQDRFQTVPELEDYKTIEQCSIEYRKVTGACIDPHIDDCWIWGERVVQLHLLSDSVLTLTPYFKPGLNLKRYNLKDVSSYPRVLDEAGNVIFNPFRSIGEGQRPYEHNTELNPDLVVRVPLPRRSLLILYGELRYDWEHCILRSDIVEDRRVIIAYRELTPLYLPGGKEERIGKEILEAAANFWPH